MGENSAVVPAVRHSSFSSQLVLSSYFSHFNYADANSWKWIQQQERNVAQVWYTKQEIYRRTNTGCTDVFITIGFHGLSDHGLTSGYGTRLRMVAE